MVAIPSIVKGIVVGLLLSDAWLQKGNATGQPRLGFKQSLGHSGYFFQVFFLLSH
jgi:hypothetical protein